MFDFYLKKIKIRFGMKNMVRDCALGGRLQICDITAGVGGRRWRHTYM